MTDKELRREERLKLRLQGKENYIRNKALEKAEHKQLNEFIKQQKLDIKALKVEYKNTISAKRKEPDVTQEQLILLKDNYVEKELAIKTEINKRKFDFGERFKTITWQCLKWIYGIKKEFNRIIWSNPTNTFKYLGIIMMIIMILAGLFFGIDAIIDTFRK